MEKSSSTDSLASLSIIDDHFERRQRDASKSSRRRVLIGVGSLAILLLFFTIGFNASSSNVLGSASFGTSSALDRMRASEATFQRMKQRRADFIASKGGLVRRPLSLSLLASSDLLPQDQVTACARFR